MRFGFDKDFSIFKLYNKHFQQEEFIEMEPSTLFTAHGMFKWWENDFYMVNAYDDTLYLYSQRCIQCAIKMGGKMVHDRLNRMD